MTGLREINGEHARKETKVRNDSVTRRVSALTRRRHRSVGTRRAHSQTPEDEQKLVLSLIPGLMRVFLVIYLSVDGKNM